MTDKHDDMVLCFLRDIWTKLEEIEVDVRALKERMGKVETQLANVGMTVASLSVRLDKLDERVARIERRLDLAVPS